MKHTNYEECFSLQHSIGFIKFTKNKGMDRNTPYIHISSIITMQQTSTCYHEQFDYVIIQHKQPSLIIHHFWKKNKEMIMPDQIPPSLFQLLVQKRPSDTMYSSHPHHL